MFSGPFSSVRFAHSTQLPTLVNATKSFDALGFGFAGWKIAVSKYKVTRLDDRMLERPSGKKIKTRFYTSELEIPMGTFKGETWVDDTGVVLKSILNMPFGTVTVMLD